jgi:hypothetical protein
MKSIFLSHTEQRIEVEDAVMKKLGLMEGQSITFRDFDRVTLGNPRSSLPGWSRRVARSTELNSSNYGKRSIGWRTARTELG